MIMTPEYLQKIRIKNDPLIIKIQECRKILEEMIVESKQRREENAKITLSNDGRYKV